MGAIIAIDQDRPGPSTSSGTAGVARKDLWQNRVVRPRSTEVNASYAWTLLNKPSGSSAALTDANLSTCSFTPDLPGSYRIQLVTNGGGVSNVQVLVAAVTFDEDGESIRNAWRVPAFGERVPENNFSGSTLGWFPDFEKIILDLGAVFGIDTVLNLLTVRIAETVNAGTVQGRANTREDELVTSDNALHTLSELVIPPNSLVLHEVEVLCINDDATIGGYFKRSKAHLSTGASVTSTQTKNVDRQFIGGAPTWDIVLDDDGAGNARIQVNSQGDTVTWYVVRQGLRVVSAP